MTSAILLAMSKKAIALLQHKFNESKAANPQFSLRSFAQRCGLSPGSMSEILNGKRGISDKQSSKIATNLKLNPTERALLVNDPIEISAGIRKVSFLSRNHFFYITEGIHFDFLALMDTDDFVYDLHWLADKLGTSSERIQKIITRLKDIHIITENEGRLEKIKGHVSTTDDITDEVIQLAHADTLRLAKESLFRDSIHDRDFTSICLPLDPALIKQVKEKIRNFHMEIRELTRQGTKTEVYELAMQFFPKTKKKKGVRK